MSEFLSKEIVAAAAAAQRRTGPSAPPSRLVVDGSCESDEESDDDGDGDGDGDEVSKKSSVSDEELKRIAEESTWISLFDSFGVDVSEAKSLQAKFDKAVAQIIDMRG